MDRVVMQRAIVGICNCAVCAVDDAPDEEILALANRENPSGTEAGWTSVDRSTGNPSSPVKCEADHRRTHFILTC